MSPESTQMFLHIKPYGYRRTSALVKSPMSDGDRHVVNHERLDAARSGLMSECHVVTTGTLCLPWPQWSDAMVLQGFAVMMMIVV